MGASETLNRLGVVDATGGSSPRCWPRGPEWRLLPEITLNKLHNKQVRLLLVYVERVFAVSD